MDFEKIYQKTKLQEADEGVIKATSGILYGDRMLYRLMQQAKETIPEAFDDEDKIDEALDYIRKIEDLLVYKPA
jgi:hypothetical protein